MKDAWYLELSSAEGADLPFGRIDHRKISCTFKGSAYAVATRQGMFTQQAGSGLRVTPEKGRIALDFSAR